MNCDAINKRIKSLIDERNKLLSVERQVCTYSYIAGEEPVIPEYSFEKTQSRVDEISEEIVRLKHVVNKFNTTTLIPGTELTVDAALVRLPILTEQRARLERLRSVLPISRSTSRLSGGASEYTVRNFDPAVVEEEYASVCNEQMLLQQGLNIVNLTVDLPVD